MWSSQVDHSFIVQEQRTPHCLIIGTPKILVPKPPVTKGAQEWQGNNFITCRVVVVEAVRNPTHPPPENTSTGGEEGKGPK